jgi:hypothetical protein
MWTAATKVTARRGSLSWTRRALSETVNKDNNSHIKGASKAGYGPIGADGRHELWREGIYDHDNEPK